MSDACSQATEEGRLALSSMFVPRPVISLAVSPKKGVAPNVIEAFGNALQRFSREDPTLRVHVDDESKQTILSGMGELHLDVYVQRMLREYKVDCDVGAPKVNYREAIGSKSTFDYLHKKQTGGSGQYARVTGYIEPLEPSDDKEEKQTFEFVNEIVGTSVPHEFFPSCEKGARDAVASGTLIGSPIEGIRIVLTDGAAHAVDSSDLAFRSAMAAAVRGAVATARPVVLEPIMSLEVTVPAQYQGDIIGALNQRRGLITNSDMSDDGQNASVSAEVPLALMFGYSTVLRSATQGKGEFSMEYCTHQPCTNDTQTQLIKDYVEKRTAENAAKK